MKQPRLSVAIPGSVGRLGALLALGVVVSGGLALASAADSGGVELTIERTLEATPDEITANAPRWVQEITEAVKSLKRLDEAARRGRGGQGLECVSENLKAAESMSQVSDAALKTIEGALASGDQARASFEYRKIAIAVKRARTLTEEAERCALGEGIRDGVTRRKVTGSPGSSVDETVGLPNDIVEYGFDPPDASPF